MPHIRSDAVVSSALRDSDRGMPDAANAAKHGVAVKTIRRWRRLYQRQGLPRGQQHTQAPCPRCHGTPLDEEAYAELFGWYLGDGHISTGRRAVYSLHIFNDARYVELNAHVAALIRLVKPQARPHTRDVPGCTITTCGWKHWPCLFPQHGPGRKHERELVLEPWQQAIVRAHPGPFIRGLFHSDGCRFTNTASRTRNGVRTTRSYPRWMFTNHSAEIQVWCKEALDALGVPWTQSFWKTVSVATKAGVAALDEIVGPKA